MNTKDRVIIIKGKTAYEKVGFKEVGRRKEHVFSMGKFHDMVYMEIFKEEFYKTNEKYLD